MAPARGWRTRLLLALCALTCALAIPPHDLSNFQGKWPCSNAVLMGKPKARCAQRCAAREEGPS